MASSNTPKPEKKKTKSAEISKSESKTKKDNNKKPKLSNNGNSKQQGDGFRMAFPMNRIRTIIKCEDPVMRVSKEALMAINTAVERFIEQFVQDTYACAAQDSKKSLHYDHLANAVSKERRYDFLSDFVPERVKAEDALRERSSASKGGC